MHLTKLVWLLTVAAFLLSVTIFSIAGTCRVATKYDRIFAPYFTKVGVANWGVGGAYVAEWDCPTAAFTNPAGLSTERTILYVEGGRRLPAHWLGIEGDKWDNQFILPGFASVIKPFGDLSLSMGCANFYDYHMETEVLIYDDPSGTPRLSKIEDRLVVHTFYGAGSYSFENRASVGFTLGLNYLRGRDRIAEVSAEGDGLGVQFIAGGLLSPFQGLNIGATFRQSTKIEYNMQYHTGVADTFSNPDIDSNLEPEPIPFEAKFPWSLQVGASYSLTGWGEL